MDLYENYPSHLSIVCNELLPRIQVQSYTVDTYFLQSVVDRIFNNSQIDLLSIFSQTGNEYEQIIELIGVNSRIFKVSFLFLTFFCVFLYFSYLSKYFL